MALKHRQQNLGCPMVHLSYSLKRQLLCTLLYHVNIVDYIYLGYYMPPIREQHNTTPSHFETIDVNNYKNIFFKHLITTGFNQGAPEWRPTGAIRGRARRWHAYLICFVIFFLFLQWASPPQLVLTHTSTYVEKNVAWRWTCNCASKPAFRGRPSFVPLGYSI